MKQYLSASLIIFTIMIFSSCDSSIDEIVHLSMKDGQIIGVISRAKEYASEDLFVHSVSLPKSYIPHNTENLNYVLGDKYELYDYDDVFTIGWEKSIFGEWASNYGLIPGEEYYTATNVYVKYLSPTPTGLAIYPKVDNDNMGYIPGVDKKTFLLTTDKETSARILQTCEKCVVYNKNGELINISINNLKTKLIWKILIMKDGWD